jgi:uncharacterized protein YjbI with pentapeptide repeats
VTSVHDAFEKGATEWTDAGNAVVSANLSRTILQYANHDGSTFTEVDFRGATLRSCYFCDCTFVRCDLTRCAFEGSTFLNASFAECSFEETVMQDCALTRVDLKGGPGVLGPLFRDSRIEGLQVEDVRWEKVTFSNCPGLDCRLSSRQLCELSIISVPACSVTVENGVEIHVRLTECSGSISIEDTSLTHLSTDNCNDLQVLLRNVIVRKLSFARSDSIQLNAIQAMIFDADLNSLDLPKSTFVGSALVGCIWPSPEGVSHWSGRYSPPRNLIGQPITDVAGVPEVIRQ